MPHDAWSEKLERQYQHIKEGLEERGRSEGEAEGDRGPYRQQGEGPCR
jgi:hypothetical protein